MTSATGRKIDSFSLLLDFYLRISVKIYATFYIVDYLWYVSQDREYVCVIHPPLMASTNGVADMVVVDAIYTVCFVEFI